MIRPQAVGWLPSDCRRIEASRVRELMESSQEKTGGDDKLAASSMGGRVQSLKDVVLLWVAAVVTELERRTLESRRQ